VAALHHEDTKNTEITKIDSERNLRVLRGLRDFVMKELELHGRYYFITKVASVRWRKSTDVLIG